MHIDSKWRDGLISCSGERLQKGEGNWVGQIVCFI